MYPPLPTKPNIITEIIKIKKPIKKNYFKDLFSNSIFLFKTILKKFLTNQTIQGMKIDITIVIVGINIQLFSILG